MANTSTNHIFN